MPVIQSITGAMEDLVGKQPSDRRFGGRVVWKFHAAGRAIVGNEHVVEDHYSDCWPYLAENLSEAWVLARGMFKSRRPSAVRRRRRQRSEYMPQPTHQILVAAARAP